MSKQYTSGTDILYLHQADLDVQDMPQQVFQAQGTTTTGYEADLVDGSEEVELVNSIGESDDWTRVGMIQ